VRRMEQRTSAVKAPTKIKDLLVKVLNLLRETLYQRDVERYAVSQGLEGTTEALALTSLRAVVLAGVRDGRHRIRAEPIWPHRSFKQRILQQVVIEVHVRQRRGRASASADSKVMETRETPTVAGSLGHAERSAF